MHISLRHVVTKIRPSGMSNIPVILQGCLSRQLRRFDDRSVYERVGQDADWSVLQYPKSGA